MSPSTRIFPVMKAPMGFCSPFTTPRNVCSSVAMTQSAGS